MLGKISMCSCYTEYFHNKENEYVFTVTVKRNMFILYTLANIILLWQKKPDIMTSKCFCVCLGPYETCEFCYQIRYLLHLRAYRFCLRTIPINIQQHLVPLADFLTNSFNFSGLFFPLTIRK